MPARIIALPEPPPLILDVTGMAGETLAATIRANEEARRQRQQYVHDLHTLCQQAGPDRLAEALLRRGMARARGEQ